MGVVQLDQDVVTAREIARNQFRLDSVVVGARCAEQREVIGLGIQIPGTVFITQIENRVDIGERVIRIRIELEVDSEIVAVSIEVGEQSDVDVIEPEVGIGQQSDVVRALLGASLDGRY